MVAGEFAVLEPYHHLVVMAVDRFVYTEINDYDTNIVTLKDFQLHDLEWQLVNGVVLFNSIDKRLAFVKEAIEVTLTYIEEMYHPLHPFSLTITSELDDNDSGLKYGLGSSAAVVTSIVTAILTKFLPESPTREMIFKLASIAHIKTQGNGSGADIAASTYGGVINYTSFQAEWLNEELNKQPKIVELVHNNWKFLSIKPMKFPSNIQVCIGWTGSPASTGSLVSHIKSLKDIRPDQYTSFLAKSEQAVSRLLRGMEQDDDKLFLSGIKQNREALAQLGLDAKVELETEMLYRLSMKAEDYGGAGKLSGAGGGDCGLAFIPHEQSCQKLHEDWDEIGIKPLHIAIHLEGSGLVIIE